MRASQLIARLETLRSAYGDIQIAVMTKDAVFDVLPVVDYDQFEPGGPGYALIEADEEDGEL
jgi:hypothetical protein